MYKRSVFLLLLLFTVPSMAELSSEIPRKIILATTNWCPYACEGSQPQLGIVHEYIETLFSNMGIDVVIKFYPWTRAIKEVESGRANGLLTAVHEEAPSLLFTKTPIMAYKVCFFSGPESHWRFNGVDSLADVALGAIKDYGYGPLVDEYIRHAHGEGRVHLISGGREIMRFMHMLELGRIGAFLDDQYVIAWQARAGNNDFSQLRNVGCLEENPFYMAFNPSMPGVKALIRKLNAILLHSDNKQLLKRILNRYLTLK